jgi:hypothetical protein
LHPVPTLRTIIPPEELFSSLQAAEDDRKKPKRSKRKDQKRIYYGGRVVNTIDLSEDLPVLCEARANRILSQMDIYRDTSSPFSEQQHRTHILQATELQPHNYYDATARV